METDRSYYELATVGDSTEFDFLRSKIGEFNNYVNRPITYFTMLSEYVGRLDLIAYKVYGDTHLWWAIALANDISDPFDDSLIDTALKVPNVLDVYEFYDANYITETIGA